MSQSNENAQRENLKRAMQDDLNRSVDERVNRYLEIVHQWVIPAHHFANASAECIYLYRDGYFLSAVMVSQSVTEGVWRFVLDRNNIQYDPDRETQENDLVQRTILSRACADAFGRIFHSFRNDVHHMNPSVRKVPFREIARRNLVDLATIEREIFAVTIGAPGRMVPVHRQYWDIGTDGTTSVFLRNT